MQLCAAIHQDNDDGVLDCGIDPETQPTLFVLKHQQVGVRHVPAQSGRPTHRQKHQLLGAREVRRIKMHGNTGLVERLPSELLPNNPNNAWLSRATTPLRSQ